MSSNRSPLDCFRWQTVREAWCALGTGKKVLGAAILAVLVAVGMYLPGHSVISLTDSLSHRFFWITDRHPKVIRHGDYVVFRFADIAARYNLNVNGQKVNHEFVKIVGCDEGETISSNTDKEYYCNGVYLGKAKDRSRRGEPLQNFVMNGPVPPGRMFVIGQHKDSFDSRYFGPIEKSRVTALAVPVF